MQDAKDTFYVTLRDRVAAGNPARTVVIRGTVRPGVVVEENELPTAWIPADVFWLQWMDLRVDREGAVPLAAMTCSIRYATDGDAGVGGMDRGRLLAAMDAELAAALGTWPRNVRAVNSATGANDATNLFWGDATFGAAAVVGERLERVATVEVFGYVETGA